MVAIQSDMSKAWMFEVWMSSGSGMQPGPRFAKLTDALNHVGAHIEEASFAIKLPNGMWLENSDHRVIFDRVERAQRCAGRRVKPRCEPATERRRRS